MTRPARSWLVVAIALAVLCSSLLGRGRDARAEQALAPLSVAQLRGELERIRATRAGRLPDGALLSIAFAIDVAERIAGGFRSQAEAWRKRAARYLALADQGIDPLAQQRGKIFMRGYRSVISEHLQGYAVYVPPAYDASRSYPLLVMLHGGSANGNLFLGVVLGNNMNWKDYSNHLWDEFEPRWSPDWIVVAPDGFGQVMWRWMGEQDVLDVIADVQRHYNVDRDRIALGGLSNGGVGAYNLGMRHADRFSVVQAIAGAPSWLQYTGGEIPEPQKLAMTAQSGMELIENAIATDFRYYHGRNDGGPMKPRFIEALGRVVRTLGVPFKETWFDTGHDLLYLVHRGGRIYRDLEPLRRRDRPSEVRVVTGDYRAARQHWAAVTRIERYPELARLRAVVSGSEVAVETRNILGFTLDLAGAPLADAAQIGIRVDGLPVASGTRAALGRELSFTREAAAWHVGVPRPSVELEKRPGSCGPITDAYYDAMLHVYGSADPATLESLKQSAVRGAQGWPLWLWRVQQRVLPDTEVTDELMRSHHLVLYATPGSNRVLERIADQLPVRLESDAIRLGTRLLRAPGVGAKFVFPNPLAKDRYVIVQAAPTPAGVAAGNRLPDFLPDYVVYDAKTTASRPRLVFDRGHKPLAMGYFDRNWRLAETNADSGRLGAEVPASDHSPKPGDGAKGCLDGKAPNPRAALLTQGVANPLLAAAARDQAQAADAAGETQAEQAAHRIARIVPTFTNYRSKILGATWVSDPVARWSIRDNPSCLQALQKQGVPMRSVSPLLPTPLPAPVEITGPVAGVTFRMVHANRSLLMSCELAVRIPLLARVAASHDVRAIDVISAYRDHPYSSFHTFGLALDLARFVTGAGILDVLRDFEKTPHHETCKAPPAARPRARTLREIACELGASKRFSSVLTPNYNAGHRDHFHLDIRPDDDRVFVR